MAFALLVGLGILGTTVPVPVAALGRGPTYNTLDDIGGTPVVAVKTLPTYPTSGHLNMTTVGVIDRVSMFQALGMWASGDHQVVPRDSVFPPGKPAEKVNEENREQFNGSVSNAEVAALDYLRLPTSVVVGEIVAGSPSAGTLMVGDQLLEVADRPIRSVRDLHDALAGTHPGQQVGVRFQRSDLPAQDAVVTLGARADDSRQGLLGVAPLARPADDDEIVISLSDIGGPSAGLMFALAVVDKLTPGELTGGTFIAGTGAIQPDGVVIPIRGVPFKMRAAREAGATVFLVPAANCEEARSTRPDGLRLVKVEGLADAVAHLDTLRAGGTPPTC